MGSDMIVMVMIHHGDTLYHDQGDMAPLLGSGHLHHVFCLDAESLEGFTKSKRMGA